MVGVGVTRLIGVAAGTVIARDLAAGLGLLRAFSRSVLFGAGLLVASSLPFSSWIASVSAFVAGSFATAPAFAESCSTAAGVFAG